MPGTGECKGVERDGVRRGSVRDEKKISSSCSSLIEAPRCIPNFFDCCCSYFVFSIDSSFHWLIDYHSHTRTHFCNTPWHNSDPDLQIYAVTPIPDSQDVLQRDGVPDNIKSFYKVNNIWRFRYDRPFHKGTKDKENEFKVGWPWLFFLLSNFPSRIYLSCFLCVFLGFSCL